MAMHREENFKLKASLSLPDPFLPSSVLLHGHLDLVSGSTVHDRLDVYRFDGSVASSAPLDRVLEGSNEPCQTSIRFSSATDFAEAETIPRWHESLPACDAKSNQLVESIERIYGSDPRSPQFLTLRASPNSCGLIGTFRGYRLGPWSMRENQTLTSGITHLASEGYRCAALIEDPKATGQASHGEISLLQLDNLAANDTSLATVSRSCELVSMLIEYIAWCTDWARLNWRGSRRLLDDYISEVEESLSEAGYPDLTTSLYSMALTGICSNPIKAWLTDGMGTEGINRWYGTFGVGLKMVLDVCEQYLRPALDWATVEVHELRTLCGHPGRPICQIDIKLLTALLNDLEVMRSLLHSASDYVVKELYQVHIFADWIMNQHLVHHDPTSSLAKEAEKKIPETDYPNLLEFMQGGLTNSHLNIFFGRDDEQIKAAGRRPRQSAMPRIVDAMLKRHRDHAMQPKSPIVELINIKYLALFLEDSKTALVKHITGVFDSAIEITEDVCELPLPDACHQGLRMVREVSTPRQPGDAVLYDSSLYLLSMSKNPYFVVTVTRWTFLPKHDASIDRCAEISLKHDSISWGNASGMGISDVKFLDDTFVIQLATYDGAAPQVNLIPYGYEAFERPNAATRPWHKNPWATAAGNGLAVGESFTSRDLGVLNREYPSIPFSNTWGPNTLTPGSIKTRCTRRHRRVLIIAKDYKSYQIWDLDLAEAKSHLLSRSDLDDEERDDKYTF